MGGGGVILVVGDVVAFSTGLNKVQVVETVIGRTGKGRGEGKGRNKRQTALTA